MHKRHWEWPRPFDWDPATTALVVIDMQQGFIEDGAALEVPMARAQVPTIAHLLQAFRDRDLAVLHTRFIISDDEFIPFYRARAGDRGLRPTGEDRSFAPGSDEAAITPALAPRDDEPVVDKVAYDGFADTALEGLLRSRDVDTLVIVGTVVNWCVDTTLRAAFHRRFKCIAVSDGVSGYDHAGATGQEWVDRELDMWAESLAMVTSAADVVAALDDPTLRVAGTSLPTPPSVAS